MSFTLTCIFAGAIDMVTKTDIQKIEGQEGEVKELEHKFKKKVSLDDREEVPSDPVNSIKDITHNGDNKHGRTRKNQKDDNKDPTDIPKSGKYYMHDDRGEVAKENNKRKSIKNDKEWKHDKFDEEKDIPKCKDGFDKIHNDDVHKREELTEKTVKGRGKTRYGKKESLEMDEVVAMKLEKKKSKYQDNKVGRKRKTELKNEKQTLKIEKEEFNNKKQETNVDKVAEDKNKTNNRLKLKSLKASKSVRMRDRIGKPKNNFKTKGKINYFQEENEKITPKRKIIAETNKNKNEENVGYVKKYEVGGHVITQPVRNVPKLVSDQSYRRNYTNNRNVNTSKSLRGASNMRRGSRGGRGGFHYRRQINTTSVVQQAPVAVYVPSETIPYSHVIQYTNVIPTTPILPPTGAVYFNIPSTQQHPKPEKRERKILPIAEPSEEINVENKS